jgi:hypothetical protein
MTIDDNEGATPDYMTLYQLGDVLDAVDAGLQVFEVSTYREVLWRARQFILRHWGHPALARECNRSGALGDLYAFTEYEKRLAPKLALLSDQYTGWGGPAHVPQACGKAH